MSITTQEPTASALSSVPHTGKSQDWEAPAGGFDARVRVRVERLRFTYRGFSEPHWVGQPCDKLAQPATDADQCVIALACGCQALVPWWTLEPVDG